MAKRFYLYGLLLVFVFLQVILMKHVSWFPDIILLMVVFAGVFRGAFEGVCAGFIAGFLRGSFSVDTFLLDMFLFAAVGLLSSVMGKMLYRQHSFAQILVTSVSVFCLACCWFSPKNSTIRVPWGCP